MIGQVPAKGFLPSAPYGASPAANVLNPSQPAAQNPQTPLLPPSFTDPGRMLPQQSTQPIGGNPLGVGGENPFYGRGGGNPQRGRVLE